MINDVPFWIFVDDATDEANAFAEALSNQGRIKVEVLGPHEAREKLLTGKIDPHGVLMDVDLSNCVGEYGTGPGIAQDIRVKQRSGAIKEFPVIRFAGAGPVRANILGDPSSDDLFDLKIPKERLYAALESVCGQLEGVDSIYQALARAKAADQFSIASLAGLDDQEWQKFGHPVFEQRVLGSLKHSVHVAAAVFLKSFLVPAGLLIDESLLAVRLGVDRERAAAAFDRLRDGLPFRYEGVASGNFPRWWARAFDEWWFSTVDAKTPPSALSAAGRVDLLKERLGIDGLVSIEMPEGSAGSRPWRLCALHLEKEPPEIVPVDPAESVRLTSYVETAPWQDPQYAALGIALSSRLDSRLSGTDVSRLARKYIKP